MSENLKAVIYARYSSDNQREESIEGQLRECLEYANKIGVTVVENYIDRALTATSDNRPDFQRMIRDSNKHCFDMVIVWKLDFINAIYLYDDKITFTLNYKDGTKIVFLTDLDSVPSGSDLKCFTAPQKEMAPPCAVLYSNTRESSSTPLHRWG